MPELPEVETIKNTLEHLVLNKTIQEISVRWPKIVQYPDDLEIFKEVLKGQTIQQMDRRGKFLLFYLDTHVLISHLRMEGKYGVHTSDAPDNKHTHVVFHFTDGYELRYQDVRKFGTMHVFPIGTEFSQPPLDHLGPEPLSDHFTLSYLRDRLKTTERHIKTVLLDQRVVAGFGNIYVDEALFHASIHPMRRASDLSKREVERLHESMVLTLSKAVEKGGTTIRSYVNSQGQIGMFQLQLQVYGREGEGCLTCSLPITKMKVANRGTHVCLNCQQ